MMVRASVMAALALGVLGLIGVADPPPQTPRASIREAIYFGPAGPVRIRLHLSIDGRSADVAWNEAINELFTFCDRDGNGFLEATERAAFVTPNRRGQDVVSIDDGSPSVQPLRLTFAQKDEPISRAAFVEAVRISGHGAIGMRIVPTRPESRQLSLALFRHLDQNGDGRLSVEELKAARERLAVLDVDEDEYLTTAELVGRGVANVGRGRVVPPGTRPGTESSEPSMELLFLTTDGVQAVKQLLAARGSARATTLRPAEFGSNAKSFAALDQDGNGVLDTTELTAWLRQPPDLELTVAFDSQSSRLNITSPTRHRADKNGALLAVLPGGHFQFASPLPTPAKDWSRAADRIREQFKELAKEKGCVERKQLENQFPALAFFDLADRNGDGKVDAIEVEAARKVLAPLANCRIDVVFVDHGNGLFELLDRNGDGRLSPRELVGSVTILKPFAGADGNVGPKDLVRQFQVRLVVDPIPVGVLIPPIRSTTPADPGGGVAMPSWFKKMDRNGDGDVSLREFVGPIELFRKLDRNGDGLISPDEAIAAGK